MEQSINNVLDLVSQQAEDEGLWFIAETAPEAYLQDALRRLHETIENELGDSKDSTQESDKNRNIGL